MIEWKSQKPPHTYYQFSLISLIFIDYCMSWVFSASLCYNPTKHLIKTYITNVKVTLVIKKNYLMLLWKGSTNVHFLVEIGVKFTTKKWGDQCLFGAYGINVCTFCFAHTFLWVFFVVHIVTGTRLVLKIRAKFHLAILFNSLRKSVTTWLNHGRNKGN